MPAQMVVTGTSPHGDFRVYESGSQHVTKMRTKKEHGIASLRGSSQDVTLTLHRITPQVSRGYSDSLTIEWLPNCSNMNVSDGKASKKNNN